MAQNTFLRQISHNQKNIIDRVSINPQITTILLDVLGDIASSVRLRQGGRPKMVSIGAEFAHITPAGTLNLVSIIENERVEMAVPNNMWKWKTGSELWPE